MSSASLPNGRVFRAEVADNDPMARAYDQTNRGLSRRYDEVDVVVVSDSLEVDPSAPWADRTRVIGRAEITSFKESGNGVCVVFGSHRMWNGLLAQGLVDELRLMTSSQAVGGGTAAFETPASLTLKETRRADGSDNVLLVYTPVTS